MEVLELIFRSLWHFIGSLTFSVCVVRQLPTKINTDN